MDSGRGCRRPALRRPRLVRRSGGEARRVGRVGRGGGGDAGRAAAVGLGGRGGGGGGGGSHAARRLDEAVLGAAVFAHEWSSGRVAASSRVASSPAGPWLSRREAVRQQEPIALPGHGATRSNPPASPTRSPRRPGRRRRGRSRAPRASAGRGPQHVAGRPSHRTLPRTGSGRPGRAARSRRERHLAPHPRQRAGVRPYRRLCGQPRSLGAIPHRSSACLCPLQQGA